MPAKLAQRFAKTSLLLLATVAFSGLLACGDESTSPPKESVDLCKNVTCEQPEDHCDQELLIAYQGRGVCNPDDGTCDYSQVKETRTCAQGQACVDGACSGDDLCDASACPQPENTCDGDYAVTYTGDGACDPHTGSCDYAQVTSRTYCSHGCLSGFCQPEEHPQCFYVDCPQPPDTCDGTTALTYSGEGTCVELDGSCDYSSVETRTDCAESAQDCVDGECVPR